MKKNIIINPRKISIVFATFLFLFLMTSFTITNNVYSNLVTYILWSILIGILLINNKMKLDKKICLITLLLIGIMFITEHTNMETYIKVSLSFIVCCLYVNTFSKDEFVSAFLKIIKLLSIFSLICYTLHFLIPQIFNPFSITVNSQPYSNLILYVQNWSNTSIRNSGFTWEAGAFATLVCLSFALEIFYLKKVEFKNIFLYVITVITTFSTTGIFAIIILVLYCLILNKRITKKTKINIVICFIIFIFIILAFDELFFSTSGSTTFGKLINFKNYNIEKSSTSIRLYSITKVTLAYLKRPLFGYGYDLLKIETFEYTYGLNTCTFINWFATYGTIFGILMVTGIYKFGSKLTKNKKTALFFLLFIFLITISENFVRNAFLLILVLYGYKKESIIEEVNKWN